MERVTAYYSASGRSHDNCCFLGQVYNKEGGYKPREGECWIIAAKPDGDKVNFDLPLGSGDWLTSLWLSDSGTLYVADAHQHVFRNTRIMKERGLKPDSFESFAVGASLSGIWGLSDDCVFTWGQRYDNTWEYPVFRWDGKAWTELPSPGFKVLSMHGLAPDFVYAAGHDGGIASWDGTAWKRWAVPEPETFTSIFVASDDQMYAVGVNNSVLEGSRAGWGKIAQGPAYPVPLSAVARWKGELWIGAGTFGLLRRVGTTNQLEVVKPNIHAIGFDARHNLVISCPDLIASTADGVNFRGTGKGMLLKAREGKSLF